MTTIQLDRRPTFFRGFSRNLDHSPRFLLDEWCRLFHNFVSRDFLSHDSFSLSSQCPKPRWLSYLFHTSSEMDAPDSFSDFYEMLTIFHVSSLMDSPGPFVNSPFAILAWSSPCFLSAKNFKNPRPHWIDGPHSS
jgi:hypothetical protein